MGKQYIIEQELADKILAYLAEEKYKDVYELCEGLMHLQEHQPDVVVK